MNSKDCVFTWQQRQPIVQWRLEVLANIIFVYWFNHNDEIQLSITIDQSVISLHLQGKLFEKRGPGLGMFNGLLLKDTMFIDKVK